MRPLKANQRELPPSARRFLHDRDLVGGEVMEFVHQPVNLLVGGGDLALEEVAVGGVLRRSEALVYVRGLSRPRVQHPPQVDTGATRG